MADLRPFNIGNDPMQALRNLLEMQREEYDDAAVLTEAHTRLEYEIKARQLNDALGNPEGEGITGEDSRFAAHCQKRLDRFTRDYAEWLESSENTKRECAAVAIFELVLGVVDTHLCHYEYAIDGHGKRRPIEDIQEATRVAAESAFVNTTGIELDEVES